MKSIHKIITSKVDKICENNQIFDTKFKKLVLEFMQSNDINISNKNEFQFCYNEFIDYIHERLSVLLKQG